MGRPSIVDTYNPFFCLFISGAGPFQATMTYEHRPRNRGSCLLGDQSPTETPFSQSFLIVRGLTLTLFGGHRVECDDNNIR